MGGEGGGSYRFLLLLDADCSSVLKGDLLLPCISCGLMVGPQLPFDIFIFEYSGAHEEIKTQGFEPLTSSVRSKGNGCCEDLNVQSRFFDHLALICICFFCLFLPCLSLLPLSFSLSLCYFIFVINQGSNFQSRGPETQRAFSAEM